MKEKDKKYNHPLFDGSICERCHENTEKVLMPIASDNYNTNCCFCLVYDSKEQLFLCDFCVRVYCKSCVSIYNPKGGIDQIRNTYLWECFSCEKTSKKDEK